MNKFLWIFTLNKGISILKFDINNQYSYYKVNVINEFLDLQKYFKTSIYRFHLFVNQNFNGDFNYLYS